MAIVYSNQHQKMSNTTTVHVTVFDRKTSDFLNDLFKNELVKHVSISMKQIKVLPANFYTRAHINNVIRSHKIDMKRAVFGLTYHGLRIGKYEMIEGKIVEIR